MSNPYQARTNRSGAEQVSELELVLDRLGRLNATPEELAAVAETWDTFDGDWTPEARAELVRMPDDQLRQELLATRLEYRHDTTTTGEQADIDVDTYAAATARAAADIVGRSVAEVLEWVGQDAIRAIAVLNLETGPEGGQRKTLVRPLTELVEP